MSDIASCCVPEPPAAVSRRSLLAGAGVAALAAGGTFVPSAAFAGARDHGRDRGARRRRTRLTLLGTSAGPVIRGRKGIASALLVEDTAYLVDCGMESARGFRLTGHEWKQLRHVFITHLHSDHTLDYPSVLLVGWGSPNDQVDPDVQLWGSRPARRPAPGPGRTGCSDHRAQASDAGHGRHDAATVPGVRLGSQYAHAGRGAA